LQITKTKGKESQRERLKQQPAERKRAGIEKEGKLYKIQNKTSVCARQRDIILFFENHAIKSLACGNISMHQVRCLIPGKIINAATIRVCFVILCNIFNYTSAVSFKTRSENR
jgi:hypothetical protein